MTRSLSNSGNEKNCSIYVGSHNPLYNEPSDPEKYFSDSAGSDDIDLENEGDSHPPNGGEKFDQVEQVLTTNAGGSVEEQMAQLTAALHKRRKSWPLFVNKWQIMPIEGLKE